MIRLAGVGGSPVVCCLALPKLALGRYRLSADEYRRFRAAQDGVCGICGRGNWRGSEAVPLFIDHDHLCCPDHRRACGRCGRGLLCSGCNGWLGELELWDRLPGLDDGGRWERAAMAYLARAGCRLDAERRAALAVRHRQRTAKWKRPCRCRLCASPDR
ncbi:endonuclease domain-containing protein [Micromonospora sp. PTRAS2]